MYLRRRKTSLSKADEPLIEDPLAVVANFFDLSVVFIVSLILFLFSSFHLLELFDPFSEFTITQKKANQGLEILIKKGKEIKVQRVTYKELVGEGERLGTAYRLKDGRVFMCQSSKIFCVFW
ncbi:MAG: DUF2149 domain-containing protein [Caldimicrobium sp.]|nr:DUF2149 domain-containing protein [Caldimicrobium sp.]